jgi:hypothetical protein
MSELPGKVRLQDAILANMVSIAAILEYLEQQQPGARTVIDRRAHEIAQSLKSEVELENKPREGDGSGS